MSPHAAVSSRAHPQGDLVVGRQLEDATSKGELRARELQSVAALAGRAKCRRCRRARGAPAAKRAEVKQAPAGLLGAKCSNAHAV
jgi:hypothetical protein